MLPLQDDVPARRVPVLTLGLIALNLLVFIWELTRGPDLAAVFFEWGIVPIRYTHSDIAPLFGVTEQAVPFLTHMFLHGGWLHLIGNMWILWIFGDNVEDRLGSIRFLGFYLVCGVAAALMHLVTHFHSEIPTLGASGAVAGVMGAYLRFFPHARVTTMIPPFFLGPFFVVPAVFFLGFWFFLQFFNGALSLGAGPGQMKGIAWWAHVGGFIFGAIFGPWWAGHRDAEDRETVHIFPD